MNLRPLFYGTAGAARLLRFDSSGVDLMIKGTSGFWASLAWPMTMIAPLYMLLILLRFNPDQNEFLRYLIVHIEFYVIAWLIFPVIMERFCYYTQTAHKYLDFIIAYNWLSGLYNVFFLTLGLAHASRMIETNTAAHLSVFLMIAGMVWIGYLAKKSLEMVLSSVVGLVMIEMGLSVILSTVRSIFLTG